MIDIANEHLIPVRDVPRRLPRRPNGKTVHISAVYRWIQRGVRGVRLEAIRIGGTAYTSEEALQRFGERQSQVDGTVSAAPEPTTKARRQQIERAHREVERILNPRVRLHRRRTNSVPPDCRCLPPARLPNPLHDPGRLRAIQLGIDLRDRS